METCIVLISTAYLNARKVCNLIENQKFDSREIAKETINKELDEDYSTFYDVSTKRTHTSIWVGGVEVNDNYIFRLTDFMDEVNNQHLDNLENYFISYIHINLELSK